MGQLRQPDIAARLGGDEFALLLPFTSPEGAEQVTGRLLSLVQKYELEDGTPLSISLGIAVLQAGDDERGETLVKRADQLMYKMKQSRRSGQTRPGKNSTKVRKVFLLYCYVIRANHVPLESHKQRLTKFYQI
jgi:diguanylate cyclase (GGDEF)-like protein